MYAITGITGQVGGAAAQALLAAGHPIRAILRDAGKAASWAAQGAEIAIAEFEEPLLPAPSQGSRGCSL